MDENDQNTFCFTHSTQEITFICTKCNYSPVCNKCIVLKGIHFGHEIVEIDDDSVTPILKEMNEKTIPRLDELIKNNKVLLNNNTTKYEQIEEKHKSNLHIVSDEFKKLHIILQTVQNNLNQELITNLNENNDIKITFEMKVKEELKVLSKVVGLKNDYNFIDQSANLNNKHVQIIKDAYQSKNILSSHFSQLPDYSYSTVTISDSLIKELFNLIKIKKEYENSATSRKSLKYKHEFNQSLNSLLKPVKSIYLFNINIIWLKDQFQKQYVQYPLVMDLAKSSSASAAPTVGTNTSTTTSSEIKITTPPPTHQPPQQQQPQQTTTPTKTTTIPNLNVSDLRE
ncbi:hypothetical protein ACTFIV_007530 [Dictyostelium citrinum]